MKIYILLVLFLGFGAIASQAQNKKELLAEIEKLRDQIKKTDLELLRSKQREQLTLDKLETSKEQIIEVEKEKQDLLKTISGFTSVSKQKAANLTSSLETIKRKDRQLKVINDALAAAENEKLRQLTIARDSLGTIGKVGYQNNILVISISNTNLYGDDDKAITLTDIGKKNITKLGSFLNSYPEYSISIEGNSNALSFDPKNPNLKDNWDLSALQASAIARILDTDFKIDPKRIEIAAKSEYNTKGVETETRILIKPKFDAFFELVKTNMKE